MKTMKQNSYFLIFALIINTFLAIAQEQKKQPDPIELPAFIIEGVERLSVRTGIKQNPSLTPPMSKSELDTLNNLEKHPPQMLPLDALPENLPPRQKHNGYIAVDAGKYSTIAIDGAYTFDIGDYKFLSAGNINFSNGHQKNAEFFKTNIDLGLEYVAPQKYWIFGGSRTVTNLNFNINDYSLYSVLDAPKREVLNIGLNVDVNGKYESYIFDLGGKLSTLRFTKSQNNLTENILGGYLKIKNYWKGILIGANLEIDLQNIHNRSANFFQGNVFGSYQISDFTLSLNTGLQGVNNTNNIVRGGFLIDFSLDYRINRYFTLQSSASTGLEKRNLNTFYRINPYITDSPIIDFPFNILKLIGAVSYHPNTRFGLTTSIETSLQERTPYFNSNDTATFEIAYANTQKTELSFESFWDISDNDRIINNITITTLNSPELEESLNLPTVIITHTPKIKADLIYKRQWFENFGTFFGISYIDVRYADINNKMKLNAYTNIKGGAYLKVWKNLTIMANFDNLLNSNIYIWGSYKERDMFFSFALMWHF